jgi:mRNA interferase YafQ
MYTLAFTTKFKKDFKLCQKRNFEIVSIQVIFTLLSNTGTAPSKYKLHKLTGNYSDCWECHIKPDWLLIWRVGEEKKIIELVRTGTHSDLF